MIDSLMAEYGRSLPEAMAFPLEAYLAMLPAMVARHGGRLNGPDYVDRAAMTARERCWAWLRAHFTILEPGEPGPRDALAAWLRTRR